MQGNCAWTWATPSTSVTDGADVRPPAATGSSRRVAPPSWPSTGNGNNTSLANPRAAHLPRTRCLQFRRFGGLWIQLIIHCLFFVYFVAFWRLPFFQVIICHLSASYCTYCKSVKGLHFPPVSCRFRYCRLVNSWWARDNFLACANVIGLRLWQG